MKKLSLLLFTMNIMASDSQNNTTSNIGSKAKSQTFDAVCLIAAIHALAEGHDRNDAITRAVYMYPGYFKVGEHSELRSLFNDLLNPFTQETAQQQIALLKAQNSILLSEYNKLLNK